MLLYSSSPYHLHESKWILIYYLHIIPITHSHSSLAFTYQSYGLNKTYKHILQKLCFHQVPTHLFMPILAKFLFNKSGKMENEHHRICKYKVARDYEYNKTDLQCTFICKISLIAWKNNFVNWNFMNFLKIYRISWWVTWEYLTSLMSAVTPALIQQLHLL